MPVRTLLFSGDRVSAVYNLSHPGINIIVNTEGHFCYVTTVEYEKMQHRTISGEILFYNCLLDAQGLGIILEFIVFFAHLPSDKQDLKNRIIILKGLLISKVQTTNLRACLQF